jgi:hypothetical protein
MHAVAVGDGQIVPLQHDEGSALAPHKSAGALVEGEAAPVG